MTMSRLTGARWAASVVAGVCLAAGAFVAAQAGTSAAPTDPLFDVPLDSCSYGGASAADLDGDGDLEITFGTYYNDERVVVLNHDGSEAWSVPSDGGPVDNSVTVADLDGDGSPEVMWGDSGYTTFHVADARGTDIWTATIGEVLDAPEAIGDLDGDGDLDIALASCGGKEGPGGLRVFDGASGTLLWTASVGGCYQSAPLLFDQDGDGVLDIVVSTWFDNKVRGFSGLDGSLRWEAEIGDWTYHAGSFGDLNDDGVPDVALGDYSAQLWAIDGTDGSVLWSDELPGERYVFGPTAMADVDGDGVLNVIVAADQLHLYGHDGTRIRSTDLSGYCTRGPVLTDLDDDGLADVVLALSGPSFVGLNGADHALLYSHTFDRASEHNHHPVVADLDGDGSNEVFSIFGRGSSDEPEKNWGRAVLLPLPGSGPSWPTFSHDHHHSGNYHWPPGAEVNLPLGPTPVPTLGPTPGPTPALTPGPSATPSTEPSPTLSVTPSAEPTAHPTTDPSPTPSNEPVPFTLFVPRVER